MHSLNNRWNEGFLHSLRRNVKTRNKREISWYRREINARARATNYTRLPPRATEPVTLKSAYCALMHARVYTKANSRDASRAFPLLHAYRYTLPPSPQPSFADQISLREDKTCWRTGRGSWNENKKLFDPFFLRFVVEGYCWIFLPDYYYINFVRVIIRGAKNNISEILLLCNFAIRSLGGFDINDFRRWDKVFLVNSNVMLLTTR